MPRSQLLDLFQIFTGTFLGLFVIFFPGYGLCWALNLLKFRERSWLGQVCLASPAAIAVLPILIYLPYRFLSVKVAIGVVLALAVLGIYAFLRTWKKREGVPSAIAAVLCVWVMIAIFCLVDFDMDGRVYNSALVWDHSVRVQMVSSLSHTERLPLTSYFFRPGYPVVVRYYYFSYFFPSFIQRLSFGTVTSNNAFYAFILWTGLAFLATVAAFVYFFLGWRDRRAVLVSWGLLGIGGLQILPFLQLMISRAMQGRSDIIPVPSLTFWNNGGQVTSWLDSVLWVPNHVSAVIALLFGCLLLWFARKSESRERWIAIAIAGIVFASGVGLSVYVCMIFVIFLAIIALYLLRSYRQQAVNILASGAVALIFVLPFLFELLGFERTTSPLGLWVRDFEPLASIVADKSHLFGHFAYLFALPLNYFMELGVYFLVAVWWIGNRRQERNWDAQSKLMMLLLSLAFILCSFVRSFPTNDFGWRGLLPGQFVLLLFATELFMKHSPIKHQNLGRWRVAMAFVVIGVATSAAEVVLLRSYEPLSDAGLAQRTFMLTPTLTTGMRNAQLRAAYDWIRNNTDPSAIIQQNPIITEEIQLGLYAERSTSVYGRSYILFPTKKEYTDFRTALVTIARIYQPGVPFKRAHDLCGQAKLDYIVTQDLDPVWGDPSSFVWKEQPLFETPMVRVFHCSQ